LGQGIFLEEYATDNWFTQLIEINIAKFSGSAIDYLWFARFANLCSLVVAITGRRSILAV